ncbi:MAG TPA: glycosyltransferase, partial [Candidatus Omnitrophica bacterium]|nr:glycosyltransferase [Candidatus Omnitrophota bacterium]
MAKRSLKILILPNQSYHTNRAMLTEFWNKEFSKLGHRVIWVTQSEKSLRRVKIGRWKGSKIYLIPTSPRTNLWEMIKNIVSGLIYKFIVANNIMREENVDIVHAHDGAYEGILGLYLSKRYKKIFSFGYTSLFTEMERSDLYDFRGIEFLLRFIRYKFREIGYKLISRHADMVFPISRYMGERLAKNENVPIDKIFPIPQCATEHFLNFKADDNKEKEKEIIYTGTLGKPRKIDFLLKTFKLVLEAHCDAKLLLVGWGERKGDVQDLVNYAKKLGIEKNVEFTGKQPYHKMPAYISKAMVGVSPIPPLPHFLVSTPTKCVEYLSLGIPAVANKEIYDLEEMLTKSGGGFAVKYDENEFADSIIWLLKHPEEAKGLVSELKTLKKNADLEKKAIED